MEEPKLPKLRPIQQPLFDNPGGAPLREKPPEEIEKNRREMEEVIIRLNKEAVEAGVRWMWNGGSPRRCAWMCMEYPFMRESGEPRNNTLLLMEKQGVITASGRERFELTEAGRDLAESTTGRYREP